MVSSITNLIYKRYTEERERDQKADCRLCMQKESVYVCRGKGFAIGDQRMMRSRTHFLVTTKRALPTKIAMLHACLTIALCE